MKTAVIIIISLVAVVVLGASFMIMQLVPVRSVQTAGNATVVSKSSPVNSEELTRSIVDQVFPGSRYTLKDGMINFSSQIQANYQTLYLEQLSLGKFINNEDEYLAVLRAPENVTVHAGGFYYAVCAVFDGKTNTIKSPVQHFINDEGEISILNGKNQNYVLFIGSTTYQGWKEAQGMLYDLSSGQWEKAWPTQNDFWKDRYGIFGNNRLALYKRVIEPHNQESAVPPNHFELDTELIWDRNADTFRTPEMWE
jgi:hypothetical protein